MESFSKSNSKHKALISEEDWENLQSIFFSMDLNERFTDYSFPNTISSILESANTITDLINQTKEKIEELKRSNSNYNMLKIITNKI